MIILTKALGTGVLSTALKAKMLEQKYLNHMLKNMMSLNHKASQIALLFDVHAMSDVSGFGLLGHLKEMLNETISFEVFKNSIPFLEGVQEYFDMGLIPAGAYKNLEFMQESHCYLSDEELLLCDPQTSGGLLMAINENKSLECLRYLEDENIQAKIIAKATVKQEKDFIFY